MKLHIETKGPKELISGAPVSIQEKSGILFFIMLKRSVSILRKVGVVLLGVPIIVLGVILIPLPGPGVLVCILGFFILSLEFEWADRYMQKLKRYLRNLAEKAKQQQAKLKEAAKEDKEQDQQKKRKSKEKN